MRELLHDGLGCVDPMSDLRLTVSPIGAGCAVCEKPIGPQGVTGIFIFWAAVEPPRCVCSVACAGIVLEGMRAGPTIVPYLRR